MDCRLHRWRPIIIIPIIIPYNPNGAIPISPNLNIRTEIPILKAGRAKLAIAVMDTTITIAADTRPASTAARPITKVPTMETDWPIDLGNRIPASQNFKRDFHNQRLNKCGNGTPSR